MGREEHCKQISLACVGSARSVWATLGLPPLTACVLSRSTLLRLQVALQGNCKAGPGLCVLPRSKPLRFRFSGTQVLGYKGTDSVGPAFCALPRSRHSGDQVVGEHTLPRWAMRLITSLVLGAVGAPSQVCHLFPLGS